jgi:hypothetical protein
MRTFHCSFIDTRKSYILALDLSTDVQFKLIYSLQSLKACGRKLDRIANFVNSSWRVYALVLWVAYNQPMYIVQLSSSTGAAIMAKFSHHKIVGAENCRRMRKFDTATNRQNANSFLGTK